MTTSITVVVVPPPTIQVAVHAPAGTTCVGISPGQGSPPSAPPPAAPSASSVPDFAHNPATTTGLTYGFFGGTFFRNDGETAIYLEGGTVTLPANTISFISTSGDPETPAAASTSGFSLDRFPMSVVTTDAQGIVSIEDRRDFKFLQRGGLVRLSEPNFFYKSIGVTPFDLTSNESDIFLVIDGFSSNNQRIFLTSDISPFIAPSVSGISLNLFLQQDADGGHNISFQPNQWRFSGGMTPVLTQRPGAIDLIRVNTDTTHGHFCEFFPDFVFVGSP